MRSDRGLDEGGSTGERLRRQVSATVAADRVKAVKGMSSENMSMLPGMKGMPGLGGRGSTHTTSIKERFKKRKK